MVAMNEISHQQAKALIQASMGGFNTMLEKESLARHLESCSNCRAYSIQMSALEDGLRRCFHMRWDSTRGPSIRIVGTIHKKTGANPKVKNIFNYATTAIAFGVLAFVAIMAISLHPRQNTPSSGGQPNQTQMPKLVSTSTEPFSGTSQGVNNSLKDGKYIWVPPLYGQGDPESARQFVGTGVCQDPVAPFLGTGTFVWPTQNHSISGNDYDPSRQHLGIDLAGNLGDPVVASDGGVVVFAGWSNMGYGKQTLYAHLSSVEVACGEHLEQGSLIGKIGNSGNINGTWLHFEIIVDNTRVNPHKYLVPPK
jgi:murein DD-endopeptidase MepM/ murein hydrolase activator NlpD